MAVFTHVYNPGPFLDLWASYYAKIVGRENLFVLDHETTDGSVRRGSDFYQTVPVPRGELDHVNMSRFCAHFQRFLLSNYEWVMHTDCDEFLVTPAGPASFLNILDQYPGGATLLPTCAVELIEAPADKSPVDWNLPLCSQRKWCVENTAFLKPVLSSRPTTWTQGFHHCFDEVKACPDLWMVHAKGVCSEAHAYTNAAFRTRKQTKLDELVFDTSTYETEAAVVKTKAEERFNSALSSQSLREIPEWLVNQF